MSARADRAEMDRLETIEWAEHHFGSLVTNRQFPRRVMMRLVDRGLVRSAGLVTMCDDDGRMMEPERHREGFKLTDAGKARLASPAPSTTPEHDHD